LRSKCRSAPSRQEERRQRADDEEDGRKAFFAEPGHALLLGGTYASKARLA